MQQLLEKYWLPILVVLVVLVGIGFWFGGQIVGIIASLFAAATGKSVTNAVTKSEKKREEIQQQATLEKTRIDDQARKEVKRIHALPTTQQKAEMLKLANDILEEDD